MQNGRIGFIFSRLLLFVLVLSAMTQNAYAQKQDVLPGLGTVVESWSREIYPGVTWQSIRSKNAAGPQVGSTVRFSYPNTDVEAIATFGKTVYGGDSLSAVVKEVEEKGYRVVAAINGDSYDTATGVPKGMVIEEGILHTYSPSYKFGLGFTKDKKLVYGDANLRTTATIAGTDVPIFGINKQRKQDKSGAYLLTERFGSTTKSLTEGIEVVLNVSTSGYKGLAIGGSIEGKVASIHTIKNSSSGASTPIGKGQIVLTTSRTSVHHASLSKAKVGDTVKIRVTDQTKDADWSQVKTAIGIYHSLVDGGKRKEDWLAIRDLHPRTSVAVSKDGSVHLMQNEGRRAGYAAGLKYLDLVDYFVSFKHTDIFNFDGGGSSTIQATFMGDDRATLMNRPSDGRERSNANALLFVVPKTGEKGSPKALHIYPPEGNGYNSHLSMVTGTQSAFSVKATDSAYHAVAINPDDLRYAVEGEIGTVENGILIAGPKKGSGAVKVTHVPTGAEGRIGVTITGTVDNLNPNLRALQLDPNQSATLRFTTSIDGKALPIHTKALQYELSDKRLGSITSDGVFTAGSEKSVGTLTVRLGDFKTSIPVEIGKDPVVINGFDAPLDKQNWHWRYFNASGARGGDAKVSLNTDKNFVKSGAGSLKIEYDFRTKPVTGIVACEVGPKPGYGKLEGQPSGIGMWVYGDNSSAWIRVQFAPNTYTGDVFVDWDGWKYIELPIPEETAYPFEIVWGIRLVSDPDQKTNHNKGVLYFDDLTLLYGGGTKNVSAPACSIDRISGSNRFETANAISERLTDKSSAVILTSAEKYPDALVSAPLSGATGSPILLTNQESVPQSTLARMESLGTKRVYLLGGTNTIGEAVEKTLKDKGYEVLRLAGQNRYETAVTLGKEVRETQKFDALYLASGENYPDALAITTMAIKTKQPILLTTKSVLHADTAQAIQDWGIKKVHVIGGEQTIQPAVLSELESMGVETVRVAGANRFETAVRIAELAHSKPTQAYLTNGMHFVDALAAGPLAGAHEAPILLVRPKQMPAEVRDYLSKNKIGEPHLIGGANSVGAEIEKAICEILK